MHTECHDALSRAQILAFERPLPKPKGRGRPRKTQPAGKDCGTPELMMKRAQGVTAETLDVCLERGLITQQQHWCGIHLRWLHTLRHGAPSLRALDPAHLRGHAPRSEENDWRSQREQEYRDAIQALTPSGHIALVLNVCIYNDRPSFLTPSCNEEQAERALTMLMGLSKGLDILVHLWNRAPRRH